MCIIIVMQKQIWGNATWFILHVLAEKLRPESEHIIPHLIHHIESLCANLPCPDCADHASRLFSTANLSTIKDRESLRKFLYELHKLVNEKLGKHTPSYSECNQLYARGNTNKIIRHFFAVMANIRSHDKAMIYGFRRTQCLQGFAHFLDAHSDFFNP